MRLTFLGTGTSFGIPQVGCTCAVCRSPDPRDRRTRCGVLVEAGKAILLIDTPPELRLQLVENQVGRADAVLFTHEHADHVNGIDDLRAFSVQQRQSLPCYGPAETLDRLRQGFPYIFDDAYQPPPGTSKPRLELHAIAPGVEVEISGVRVLPLAFRHGTMRVFGYRLGDLAYLTDVKAVEAPERLRLQGLRVLVINALWERPHPTHLSIPEAITLAQELGAERTYLTHLTHETGHAALAARLPNGIAPAHDGLTIEI